MKPSIETHILQSVKTTLQFHAGAENRIGYAELTAQIFGSATENNRRKLRAYISHINSDETNHLVICSDRTDGGLFVNGYTAEDVELHLKFIAEEESQAIATLAKIRAMRKKLAKLYPEQVMFQPSGQGRLL